MVASIVLSALLLAQGSGIPAGVSVPAILNATVSSQTAKAGEFFTFTTTADVTAGSTTIPKGSLGQGVVASVSPAAGARRGALSLTPQFVIAGGMKVAVTTPASSPLVQTSHHHFFPMILPIPGFFAIGAIENPGGDVTLKTGTAITVVTTGGTAP